MLHVSSHAVAYARRGITFRRSTMNCPSRKFALLAVLGVLIATGCASPTPTPAGQPTAAIATATTAPLPTSTSAPTAIPTVVVPTPSMPAGGGTITGTVLYGEVAPVPSLVIQLWKQPYQQGDKPISTTTTDTGGRYVFANLPFGQYSAQVDNQSLKAQGYYQCGGGGPMVTLALTNTVGRNDFACVYKVHLVRPFDNKDLDFMQYPTSERTLTLKWEPLPDATKYAVDVLDEASQKFTVSERNLTSSEIKILTEPGHKYQVLVSAYRGEVFGRFTLGRYQFQLIAQ